jgi:hypothetical protein
MSGADAWVKITFLIGFAILIGLILLFLFQFLRGEKMDKDFCQALLENDRATLKTHLEQALTTLQPSSDEDQAFEQIQDWLSQHDCVVSVEIVPGMLRSNPPIKEFIITLHDDHKGVVVRNIGFRVFPDKLQFDYR